jgi:hypothetical protein
MDESISAEPISGASTTDPRAQRGLALAQAKKDAIKPLVGAKYLVPSAASNGSSYVVDVKAERCSCLDWAERGSPDHPHRCKHIWCLVYVLKLADGSELLMKERPRKKSDPSTWKKRDWTVINQCRTLIPRLGPQLLVELIDGAGLPGPPRRGRPGASLRDIVLTAAFREWEGATAGEAVVAIDELCARGLTSVSRVPHHNALLERFARPEVMPYLHRILAASALPMLPFETGITADATSFGTGVYDCAFIEKHGKKEQKRPPTKRHSWIDVVIGWGVNLHVVVAAQPTEHNPIGGEVGMMPELLRRSIANGCRVTAWFGDGAYCAERCAAACEKAGVELFVKWPEGRTGKTKGAALWRLYQVLDANRDLYHERCNKGRPLAESNNKMLKERFGYSLHSRTPNTMYAEVMLRLICHNVACLVMAVKELKIDPKYWNADVIGKLPDFGSTQPPPPPEVEKVDAEVK